MVEEKINNGKYKYKIRGIISFALKTCENWKDSGGNTWLLIR